MGEYKLQVVELQLEKEELEQQLAEQVKRLQEQVDSLESEKSEEKRRLEDHISTLEQSLTEVGLDLQGQVLERGGEGRRGEVLTYMYF